MSDLSSTRVHRPAGRSVTGRLIRLAFVTVVLGTLAVQLATSDIGRTGLGALLLAFVALLAVFLVVTVLLLVRPRVEVGPDSIRNRVIGGQNDLRWEDLEDVTVTTRGLMRTVKVMRRDGRAVRLTALRDAPTMPDPDFDDTVEVIRQQIARHRPRPAASKDAVTGP
jgi:hypothetical protein